MIEELYAIERNNTWELVKLPANAMTIEVKWVYKLKQKPDCFVARHKTSLVVRGFLQRTCLDYSEMYVLVAKMESVRLAIALACKKC